MQRPSITLPIPLKQLWLPNEAGLLRNPYSKEKQRKKRDLPPERRIGLPCQLFLIWVPGEWIFSLCLQFKKGERIKSWGTFILSFRFPEELLNLFTSWKKETNWQSFTLSLNKEVIVSPRGRSEVRSGKVIDRVEYKVLLSSLRHLTLQSGSGRRRFTPCLKWNPSSRRIGRKMQPIQ